MMNAKLKFIQMKLPQFNLNHLIERTTILSVERGQALLCFDLMCSSQFILSFGFSEELLSFFFRNCFVSFFLPLVTRFMNANNHLKTFHLGLFFSSWIWECFEWWISIETDCLYKKHKISVHRLVGRFLFIPYFLLLNQFNCLIISSLTTRSRCEFLTPIVHDSFGFFIAFMLSSIVTLIEQWWQW